MFASKKFKTSKAAVGPCPGKNPARSIYNHAIFMNGMTVLYGLNYLSIILFC